MTYVSSCSLSGTILMNFFNNNSRVLYFGNKYVYCPCFLRSQISKQNSLINLFVLFACFAIHKLAHNGINLIIQLLCETLSGPEDPTIAKLNTHSAAK